jgi:hypothetical protein
VTKSSSRPQRHYDAGRWGEVTLTVERVVRVEQPESKATALSARKGKSVSNLSMGARRTAQPVAPEVSRVCCEYRAAGMRADQGKPDGKGSVPGILRRIGPLLTHGMRTEPQKVVRRE